MSHTEKTSKLAEQCKSGEAMEIMWSILDPYVGHAGACSYGSHGPAGDYCSCDLAGAKSKLREIKAKLEAAAALRSSLDEEDLARQIDDLLWKFESEATDGYYLAEGDPLDEQPLETQKLFRERADRIIAAIRQVPL